MTSAIAIRSTILLFMLLLLDTRARKFEIKRNCEHFHESLNLDAAEFVTHFLLDVVTFH
jgi:hypothetical protein